jgi:hypothetical protein
MVTVEVQVCNFPECYEFVLVDDNLHDDPIGIAKALVGAEYRTDLISANVIYLANYPKKLREIQQGVYY